MRASRSPVCADRGAGFSFCAPFLTSQPQSNLLYGIGLNPEKNSSSDIAEVA
jgi:hypothetical protein